MDLIHQTFSDVVAHLIVYLAKLRTLTNIFRALKLGICVWKILDCRHKLMLDVHVETTGSKVSVPCVLSRENFVCWQKIENEMIIL